MMSSDANRLGVLEGVLRAVHMGAIVLDDACRVQVWNSWMARRIYTLTEVSCRLQRRLW